MPTIMAPDLQGLLKLLQLASPALPVGAYSYSEGLETLVHQGLIEPDAIVQWLDQELTCGLIRAEGVVVQRVHKAAQAEDWDVIAHDNQWLSALRDSEETRQQSWAMGRALVRLMLDLEPEVANQLEVMASPCNFAVAFARLAAHWQIPAQTTGLAYLHSWAANLITAAVKLVPLGQTQGQQMLLQLYPTLEAAVRDGATACLEEVALSNWGATLATMQHEAMYSRLFRS
ncbi:MAG: urease accessory protein UreF [Leptolyngbyaceae cyanobacterium SM2_5_2]|nr:urease accessory protein UreF [Leptolyngbyaceae cyanobacterium SM2_5_2]